MGVAASMAGAEGGEGDSATRRLSRFRRRSSASRVNDPTGEAHEQGSATPFPLSAELTARDTQLLQALDFHRASYVILEMGSSDSIVFASTGFSEKTGISAENAVGKAAVDLALSTLQEVPSKQVEDMRAAVGVTEEKVIELSGIAANGSQASSIWYVATLKAQADERKWRVFAQEVVGSPEEARGNPSRNLGYRIQQANLCMQRNEADSWTLFTPYKKLCTTDEKLVLTLQERMEMFCITDPAMHDNPIVFVSDDFVDMTGYSRHAINGINCRFLQGADTSPEDVDVIRDALLYEKHARVTLLNYRKDGTRFINQFALSPLREESGKLAYFIGVQIDVEDVDIQPFPNSRQTMAEMLLEFEEGVEAA